MEQSIVDMAMKQGIWALLFIYLFYFQLKEGRRREQESIERERKVMDFVDDITEQFEQLVKQYERLTMEVRDLNLQITNQSNASRNR